MSDLDKQLVISILQVLIQYGPQAYQAIMNILKKGDPTPADWDSLTQIVAKNLHDK